jgi:lathosterol oxidase
MHPVESAIFFSPLLIHIFLPSHPIHIVFHITWLSIGPATTHCGFHALSFGGKQYPYLGDFFHNLHHRFFKCNYGNREVPLDKIGGTFHDGSRVASVRINERAKAARRT